MPSYISVTEVIFLYFLIDELPIEGKIHRDIFAIFWSIIWRSPNTIISQVVHTSSPIVMTIVQLGRYKCVIFAVYVRFHK